MSMLRRRLMMQTSEPYTELEYIKSTRTQYIDTGIYPNPNTVIKMDLMFSGAFTPNGNGVGTIIGARDDNERMSCNFGSAITQGKWIYFWIGLNSTPICSMSNLPVDSRNTLVFQNGRAEYGTSSIATSTFENAMTESLVLFGRNYNGVATQFDFYDMIVFNCQIFDGDSLVRDFIPVRKSNGEVCLYDKVTKQFFTNQGTGEFEGG